MNKEKFFAELKKAKGKTNLKAQKVNLASIYDFEEKWTEAYDSYIDAVNKSGEILIQLDKPVGLIDTAMHKYAEATNLLRELEESFKELGLDIMDNSYLAGAVAEMDEVGDKMSRALNDLTNAEAALKEIYY